MIRVSRFLAIIEEQAGKAGYRVLYQVINAQGSIDSH
jgi:hypothetical protein